MVEQLGSSTRSHLFKKTTIAGTFTCRREQDVLARLRHRAIDGADDEIAPSSARRP